MNDSPINKLMAANVIPTQKRYPRFPNSAIMMWKTPPIAEELGGDRLAGYSGLYPAGNEYKTPMPPRINGWNVSRSTSGAKEIRVRHPALQK